MLKKAFSLASILTIIKSFLLLASSDLVPGKGKRPLCHPVPPEPSLPVRRSRSPSPVHQPGRRPHAGPRSRQSARPGCSAGAAPCCSQTGRLGKGTRGYTSAMPHGHSLGHQTPQVTKPPRETSTRSVDAKEVPSASRAPANFTQTSLSPPRVNSSLSQVFSWPLETLSICSGGGSSCPSAGTGSSSHLSPGLGSFRAVRITESFGVEGLSSSSHSTPCHRQGHIPLEQAAPRHGLPRAQRPSSSCPGSSHLHPVCLQGRSSTCNCPLREDFAPSAWRGRETTFLLWRETRLVTDLS